MKIQRKNLGPIDPVPFLGPTPAFPQQQNTWRAITMPRTDQGRIESDSQDCPKHCVRKQKKKQRTDIVYTSGTLKNTFKTCSYLHKVNVSEKYIQSNNL